MIVAIHQPNYLPWLGYFAKIAAADVFVLLDDVQFSKGSYTNRVQIDRQGAPAWLTVPVRHAFGAPIAEIAIDRGDFGQVHLESLKQSYRRADHFAEVWPHVAGWLAAPADSLLATNEALIRVVLSLLGIGTALVRSSALGVACDAPDVRLASLVERLAPGGTYLSGRGGGKYQNPEVFAARGIGLRYTAFDGAPYPRSGQPFLPGLSIVDALFHLGPAGTQAYLEAHRA